MPKALRHEPGVRPSPLPAAPAAQPRSWLEGEALMRELTGRPLELGYLEAVVPVFRIAHAALDTEGRQVGESNVFPKALRVEVPTQWRACIYSGTRYQPTRPMNVSALRSMRAHWEPMMAMLRAIRAAYLRRCPLPASGWTVGHLERLATVVLSVPTYALMRRDDRVAHTSLHPVLSSMFRVTDGVRMTMHQMMFVPIGEPTRRADAPISAAEVLAYAERNYSFHSEHGVCAGPQAMVEEFLRVLVDGEPATSRDEGLAMVQREPALLRELGRIDEAIDYGLRGLQTHAAVFSLWPAMARTYERLGQIARDWHGPRTPAAKAWIERMAVHMKVLRDSTYLGQESWRVEREGVYAEMYAASGAGLGFHQPDDALQRLLAPRADGVDGIAIGRLAARLGTALSLRGGEALSERHAIAAALLDHCARVRSVLSLAQALQVGVNARLGRAQPLRPLEAADLDVHQRLIASEAPRLPDLLHEIEAVFALRVRITHAAVEIEDPNDGAPAMAGRPTESTGTVPAEPHA